MSGFPSLVTCTASYYSPILPRRWEYLGILGTCNQRLGSLEAGSNRAQGGATRATGCWASVAMRRKIEIAANVPCSHVVFTRSWYTAWGFVDAVALDRGLDDV
jgi:hypothetical protein